MSDKAWGTFEERMQELEDLSAAYALASWDEQTFCAPKGREPRANLLATLAGVWHERMVHPSYGEAIDELAANGSNLSEAQRAMVRVVKHQRDREVRLPDRLVRALSEQASRTNRAWYAARPARDFSLMRGELEALIALKIEEADALDYESRFDALLDSFEPGMRVTRLDPLLMALRDELVPYAQGLLERPPPDTSFLAGPYDHARQLQLTQRVLADIGFDFDAGRQDESAHPFCGGPSRRDVRMTTRVYDSLEPGALLSSLHELGHGLYEQGLVTLERTAIGHVPSLGIHESQSRFWENVIGRSRAFWERYLPVVGEYFPEHVRGIDVETFLRGINCVQRSAIRVDADEVTYNLHILLRYELERALLDGGLAVADLPEAWGEKMRSYLGYVPAHDGEGVLQDIHWSWGELGYFPTYTLGNLYAASIGEAIRVDIDVDATVAAGEFAPVLDWLRTRIHNRGSILPSEELLLEVTGRPLDHEPFMRYLRTKYDALYA